MYFVTKNQKNFLEGKVVNGKDNFDQHTPNFSHIFEKFF